MAAGINDKFKKVSADNSYAVATTVKTARTVGGGTTLEAFDLSKWADATAVNFLTYRKTTDPVTNITTVTNRTGWTALVNTGSNTLTNLTIAPGYTDLGHQVGDYIEPVQMSKWANDLVDGILVTHNQDGTLKNKVATLGKINGGSTDGVLLTDASGNVTGGAVAFSKVDWSTFGQVDANGWTDYGTHFVKAITFSGTGNITANGTLTSNLASNLGVPVNGATPSVSNTRLEKILTTNTSNSDKIIMQRGLSVFSVSWFNAGTATGQVGNVTIIATVYGRA